MKRKFFISMALAAVAAVSVLVVACQKETPELLDLDMSQITMMTSAQQAIFDEATKRIDKYISFDADAGQYVMGAGLSAAKVGLSERFFDYFQRNFETTNVRLKQIQGDGMMAVEVSKNYLKVFNPEDGFDMLTKVLPDDAIEKGGITDVDFYWYGYDLYLSNSTLQGLSLGMQGLSVGSMWIPHPVISKIVSTITQGGAITLGAAAWKYPNGVIIKVVAGMPISIKGQ